MPRGDAAVTATTATAVAPATPAAAVATATPAAAVAAAVTAAVATGAATGVATTPRVARTATTAVAAGITPRLLVRIRAPTVGGGRIVAARPVELAAGRRVAVGVSAARVAAVDRRIARRRTAGSGAGPGARKASLRCAVDRRETRIEGAAAGPVVEEASVVLEGRDRLARVGVARARRGVSLGARRDGIDRESEVDADQEIAAASLGGELRTLGIAVPQVRDRGAPVRSVSVSHN